MFSSSTGATSSYFFLSSFLSALASYLVSAYVTTSAGAAPPPPELINLPTSVDPKALANNPGQKLSTLFPEDSITFLIY